MTISLSLQQRKIADHPIEPLSVIACAGSGKTRTAVHRLVRMRSKISDRHAAIALLSFSNVAVETFRRDYTALAKNNHNAEGTCGVEIDTVDGFITKYVLRPHAYRTMGSRRSAYLVNGNEPFLGSFTVFDGARNQPTADIITSHRNNAFEFAVAADYSSIVISSYTAIKSIERLGTTGAYTHSLGRYWAYRTLKEHPYVLRGLVRRFRHILIDEAQDIGTEHQAILELMISEGSQLSLIGDLNQGIYEFSGADGSFLANYAKRPGVKHLELTTNYRSVPTILGVANNLSGRSDDPDPDLKPSDKLRGAYYIPYKKGGKLDLTSAFTSMLSDAEISHRNATILCRASDLAYEWIGGSEATGRGIVKTFAQATIYRDKTQNYNLAFRLVVDGIVRLLSDAHGDLSSKIHRPLQHPELRPLRQALWSFAKNSAVGLPSGKLLADTEWHAALKPRLTALLDRLQRDFGLSQAVNLGNKLAKTGLLHKPLVPEADLVLEESPNIRVCTVHQAKGESIEAVMYVGTRKHIRHLLDGANHEVGRIGYVAVTRAKSLFVLAVPDSCLKEFEPELNSVGLKMAGS